MRINPAAIAALVVLSTGATLACADTASETDKLKAAVTPGEFVLTGTDVKTINDSSSPRQYRVCLKKEEGEADMKISYDDNQTRVKLGDCKTVVGKKIEATPTSSLGSNERIVGTYHHVKSKTASADDTESSSSR
ncbi:MAG TPA: hypothetical protein VMG11_05270 [Steroidobacteraceae bacterium]|nr:hypothetical protein [Steroidobacteraceae bacterium]